VNRYDDPAIVELRFAEHGGFDQAGRMATVLAPGALLLCLTGHGWGAPVKGLAADTASAGISFRVLLGTLPGR
jgi:hypothetical protein